MRHRRWFTIALCAELVLGALIWLPLPVSLASRSLQPATSQDKGDEPTKESTAPVEEPTKAPPPDERSQPEKTPTPLAGQEPTKVPTLAEVRKTPTGPPTRPPTLEPSSTPAPTHTPAQTPPPTGASTPVTTLAPAALHVAGVVFDDANGNGRQDTGEPGLPGIAVMIEEGSVVAQVLTTDSRGSYHIQAAPSAVVKVIPPIGWQSIRAGALPAAVAGDFPLQRVEDAAPAGSADPAAAQPTPLSQAVYDFSTLALAVAALGAMIIIAMERLRRALVTQFNSWALTHIRLSREALHLTRQTQAGPDDPLRILNQAVLDATGENVNLIALPQAAHAPFPAIVALADDRRRFIFTPIAPEFMRRRENRRRAVSLLNAEPRRVIGHPLDALNSSLFIADDLAAIHAAEIRKRSAGEASRLPRAQRWYLYVAPSPDEYLPARRTYLRRRFSGLRAIQRR